MRVALIGDLGADSNVVNRFYIDFTTAAGTPSTLATCASSIGTAWASHLAPLFPAVYTLTRVDIEDLNSTTAPVASVPVSHPGIRSGNLIGADTAAVMRNHVSRRYRGGHPRTYLSCFVSSDLQDPQTWSPTAITALVTAWEAFITAACTAADLYNGIGGSNHCSLSFYQGFENVTGPTGRARAKSKQRVTPPYVNDPVTSYSLNPRVGSQRRRSLQV